MSRKFLFLGIQLVAFILWCLVVPLSLFDLFSSRVEISLDLLITTYEHTSDWEIFDYMGSIKDLYQSGNRTIAILLVLLVLVGPMLKYLYAFFGNRIENATIDRAMQFLARLAFVDVFLISILLLLAYKTDYLVTRPHSGLYLLAASVLLSYVGGLMEKGAKVSVVD